MSAIRKTFGGLSASGKKAMSAIPLGNMASARDLRGTRNIHRYSALPPVGKCDEATSLKYAAKAAKMEANLIHLKATAVHQKTRMTVEAAAIEEQLKLRQFGMGVATKLTEKMADHHLVALQAGHAMQTQAVWVSEHDRVFSESRDMMAL